MVARTPRWPEGAARPQTSLCKMHPTRPKPARPPPQRAAPGPADAVLTHYSPDSDIILKFDIAADRCTFAAKAPYGLTATSSTAGPRLGRYSATLLGRRSSRRRGEPAAACRHELRDANLTDPTSGPSSASIVRDRRFHSMIARECGPPLPTTCRVFCTPCRPVHTS